MKKLFLSLVIGYFISKKLSKPITQISTDAKKLADGNYNIVFSSKLNWKKFFELNYKNKGYYLFPDEILLPIHEALNSSPRIKNY